MFTVLYINDKGVCFDERDYPFQEIDQNDLMLHAKEAVKYKYAAKVIIKVNGKTVSKVR